MEERNICKFNFNRSGDIRCTDFVYEANNAMCEQRVARLYLLGIVAKGEGTLTQRNISHPLREGSLFFVLRDEHFAIEAQKMAFCYVAFSGRRAEEVIERLGITPALCVFEGFEALIPLWVDALQRSDKGNTDLLAEAMLLYSLAHLKPDQRPQGDLITRAVMLTGERFTEADFSLSTLARELGYDTKYLSFLFKKKKGIGYVQYLRELRVKHAIFLMEQGVVSVKNVALLSGFSDALYFSKVFTKAEGVSPKAYIARLAEVNEK